MNNASLATYVFFLICVFGACNPPASQETPALKYEIALYNKENCFGERCAKVSFSYPNFINSHPYSSQINAHVEEQLKMYLQFGVFDDYESLDAAVEDYFQVFQDQKDESLWSVEVDGEVSYMTENLLSLEFKNTSITGGNHPNEHLLFLNFDLNQGNLLVREEIIFDKDQLLSKVNSAFRTYHNIDENKSLMEDGRFFLEEEEIFLPFSIGYRKENFVLYYNHYEISPYDMGPTELIFPLEDLQGIVLVK